MALTPWRTSLADAQGSHLSRDGSSLHDPPPRTAGWAGNGGAAGAELLSLASVRLSPRPGHARLHRPDDFEISSSPAALLPVDHSAASFPREDQAALDDFTRRWERGEVCGVEDYLARLGAVAPRLTVELIYREYCLAELAGRQPEPQVFLARFPEHRETLRRLLSIHQECSHSQWQGWVEPVAETEVLPEAGDEIGPYLLRRELGRGAFARVFLAEQADLENRQVVVKLSTRPTREPWLLARVRHAHIVEILSHAEVDDGAFQLICMPFLGGATLTAVLDHRRGIRRSPRARGSLLRDLDAVAAPEYAGVNPARPSRELLGSLTDDMALAWITARLAEALDHAFSRDVAHGDVKPSNILLTADGNPMLLDFNLARDGSPHSPHQPLEDLGGTLAYMAPERLRTIASGARCAEFSLAGDPASLEGDGEAGNPDPHRADLYALGMVLLEALTGSAPPPAALGQDAAAGIAKGLSELAASYATSRERGAEVVIRSAEAAAGLPIHPALRVILERCLAVHPMDRYRRGLELAEDLDRWRADRPLAYAAEPFWAQTLPRLVRRKKRLLSAATLTVAVSLVTTSLVMNASRATLQTLALHKLARSWDDIESRAFQFQRPGSPRLQNPDSPDVLAVAVRALKDYDVLGDGDWLEGDEVRSLPPGDRDDLELWLMEQAFRYCRALDDRRGSPADWLRASSILEKIDATPSLQALNILRQRLTSKLARNGPLDSPPHEPSAPPPQRKTAAGISGSQRPRHPWVDDYLLGVAAELEVESGPGRVEEPAVATENSTGALRAPDPSGELQKQSGFPGARRALEYYDRVLAWLPDSFWGHYRAAVACFRLKRWSQAAGHLDQCLLRRPGNAALRGQLTSCLWQMGSLDQALEECNRAVESAPDHAEFYRSRAFVRANRGETSGLVEDLQRFELLSQSLGKAFYRNLSVRGIGDHRLAGVSASRLALDLDSTAELSSRPGHPPAEPEEIDRDELEARAALAWTICWTGASLLGDGTVERRMPLRSKAETASEAGPLAIAAAELDKVLALDPGHIVARMIRMMDSLKDGRTREAEDDLDLVLNHPELRSFLSADPENFMFLHRAAQQFAQRGLVADALKIADKSISMAIQLKLPRGRSHYYKATVHAMAARSDPGQIPLAARQLDYAFKTNPRFRQWYQGDAIFDSTRLRINAALDQLAEATRED